MKTFTKEELLAFNEVMLGRGMPVQNDGIGYNKGDFGACTTYYHGISDAQYADLAKRLVKYTVTQLDVDREMMIATANEFAEKSYGQDRSNGISIEIRESDTLLSFRYNETYIETIKAQPSRRWCSEVKHWVVPNNKVISTLLALKEMGADVDNAISYFKENVKELKIKKEIVEYIVSEDCTWMRFKYNKEIIDTVKALPFKKFNPETKSWRIKNEDFNVLVATLEATCEFKNLR